MEKANRNVLEKIGTTTITMLVVFVMVGLAGCVLVKPVNAASYPYTPNNYINLATNENGIYYFVVTQPWEPILGYWVAREWTAFSPECWVWNDVGHQNIAHIKDVVQKWVYYNRTSNAASYIVMAYDYANNVYWNPANPTVNNFVIYPFHSYSVWVQYPMAWLQNNPPVPGSPPSSNYGLEIRFGGMDDTNLVIVDRTAWCELYSGQDNFVGMYGTLGWNPDGTHYASELGSHMYNLNGAGYTGYYTVSWFDSGHGYWVTYQSWNPSTNFVLHAHAPLNIGVQAHVHFCWNTGN